MKVSGVDLILGIEDLYAPIILRTRPHIIAFFRDDHRVTLLGHQEEHGLIAGEDQKLHKTIGRMLRTDECNMPY